MLFKCRGNATMDAAYALQLEVIATLVANP